MKIHFWSLGKSHEPYVKEGIETFTRRISHYYPVEWKLVPPVKNAASLSIEDLKKAEGEAVLKILPAGALLILLDERGKQFSSEKLSEFLQTNAARGVKDIIFLIGGAYGADEEVRQKANHTWSLSQLVFPHQLVRLILAEQIYRACTIARNEKYHHS